MPRSSSLFRAFSLLLGVLVAGCATTSDAVFPTATSLPDTPRRPDGVAIDPATKTPEPGVEASSEAGLAALAAPLSDTLAFDAVDAFFKAVVSEDGEALGACLTRDATIVSPSSGNPQARLPTAGVFYAQRFRRLDYTKLAGETLYHRADVVIARAGDAEAVVERMGIAAPSPGELALRVRLVVVRSGTDRVLGDEIIFYLRRDGAAYRIARIVEDFSLP